MAIFEFMKKAGEKIFGKNEPKEEVKTHLKRYNLPSNDLEIDVKDDKMTVAGKVKNQEEKEKIILSLGNIFGIAGVDEKLEVDEAAEEARFHTVERGDTLSKIAKEVYGNAMKYPVIFEANKPMLSDPDKIYPGQVLRIPKLED